MRDKIFVWLIQGALFLLLASAYAYFSSLLLGTMAPGLIFFGVVFTLVWFAFK